MKINLEKVGIIASYLAENTEKLYVTKLLKLFYYIDFITYNQRGASVTNDSYYKLPYGPVPTVIKNEIDLLSANIMESEVKSQLVSFISLEDDLDKNGKLVINKNKNLDMKKLSDHEIKIVEAVAKRFSKTRAKQLSNQTHREKPWILSSNNSVINYELARTLDIDSILSIQTK